VAITEAPAKGLRVEVTFGLAKQFKHGRVRYMEPSFETLVEQVRTRTVEEKEELKFLLERDLVEARRTEIGANHRRSQEEVKRGKLKFSSSIDEPRKTLAAE
jgi:hypothetical protein